MKKLLCLLLLFMIVFDFSTILAESPEPEAMVTETFSGGDDAVPTAWIDEQPEGHFFQDLFTEFQNILKKSGYVYAETVPAGMRTLALGLNSASLSDPEGKSDWLVLGDDEQQNMRPLEERDIAVFYSTSAGDSFEEYKPMVEFMESSLQVPHEAITKASQNFPNQPCQLIPLPGTKTFLELFYMPSQEEEPSAFSAKLGPLGQEDEDIFQSLPILTDTLAEKLPHWSESPRYYYAQAMVSEEDPVNEEDILHNFELSIDEDSEQYHLRHTFHFNPDLPNETILLALKYLEDQADLEGIQNLWKVAMDEGEASEMDNYPWIGTAFDQDNVSYMELVMPYEMDDAKVETDDTKEAKKAS